MLSTAFQALSVNTYDSGCVVLCRSDASSPWDYHPRALMTSPNSKSRQPAYFCAYMTKSRQLHLCLVKQVYYADCAVLCCDVLCCCSSLGQRAVLAMLCCTAMCCAVLAHVQALAPPYDNMQWLSTAGLGEALQINLTSCTAELMKLRKTRQSIGCCSQSERQQHERLLQENLL